MAAPSRPAGRGPAQVKTLASTINKRLAGLNPNMGAGNRKTWPNEPNNGVVEVDVVDLVEDRDAIFSYGVFDAKPGNDGKYKKLKDVEVPAIQLHLIFAKTQDDGSQYLYNQEGYDKVLIPYDIDSLPKGRKDNKGKEFGNIQGRAERELAKLMGWYQGLFNQELDNVENGISMIRDLFEQSRATGIPVTVKLLQKFSTNAWTTEDGQKMTSIRPAGFIQEVVSSPATGPVAAEGEGEVQEEEVQEGEAEQPTEETEEQPQETTPPPQTRRPLPRRR